MKAVVTGATGLVGSALVASLGEAVVLSRNAEAARRRLPGVRAHGWIPESEVVPRPALEGAEVVFHLAGEPVAEGRWNPDKKRRIRESRVLGTRNLVAGLERLEQRPRVLVAASAVGFYGDRGDDVLDEGSRRGSGFLAEVCEAWEDEARAAEAFGVRVVSLRIGIVLAPNGGALARMVPPFRLGAGGRLGHGRQWMPWVHLEDVVGLARLAAEEASLSGPVNVVAPHPVTNAEFTRTLGRLLRRPAALPIPAMALRVAFGELADVLLASQRVLPLAAENAGYAFRFPVLEGALRAALAPGRIVAA